MLRSLLAHSPRGTLSWLGGEAGRWAGVHEKNAADFGEESMFWARRARGTSTLLEQLAAEAAE